MAERVLPKQQFETPSDALAHYGVKGMRWGVRKEDRPGGDSSGGSAISEKKQQKVDDFFDKAAKARALAKEMDEQGIDSPAMRELYGKAWDSGDRMFAIMYGQSKETAVQKQIEFNEKRAEYLEKNATAIQEGKLTSNQKLAIVGGLAGAAVVGYVGYQVYQDRKYQNAEAGDKITHHIFTRRYAESAEHYTSTSLKSFDSLDDHDVHVPKGTVFSRLTAYKDEDMEGRLYTTFTEDDNNKYRGIYGPALKSRTGSRELYISHMEMGESVRSPSHRKRVEIYRDMLMELDAHKRGTQFVEYEDSGRLVTRTRDDAYYNNRALKEYNTFARQLVVKNPISDLYFKKVQERGYNALVDDNDAGQLADLPMILLKPKSMVSNRRFEPLSRDIEKKARKNFTEIKRINKEGHSVPEQYRDRKPQMAHSVLAETEGGGLLMADILTPAQQFETPADALAHYGVKGMRWGVRKDDLPEGVSARTSREASKDAREFARAKMFYGQGAGTRRKLIKAKVEAKMAKDPSYKKAFDHHLAKQDLGKHASKARSERRRKDVTSTTTKTVKGAHRQLTGGFGNVSLAGAALAGGVVAARRANLDKVLADAAVTKYKQARMNQANMKYVHDLLKNMR